MFMNANIKYAVGASCAAASVAAILTLLVGFVSVTDLHTLQMEIMEDMDSFKSLTDDIWRDVLVIQAKHGVLHPIVTERLRKQHQKKRKTKRQAPDGTCQCNTINRCPPGPPGGKGDVGLDGMPGMPGGSGQTGQDGIVIFQRIDRDGCQICPSPRGPPGPDGLQGVRGPRGPVGITIPFGTRVTGPPGPQGPRGDLGVSGSRGNPGVQGPKGPDSFLGVGIPGPPGRRGQRGPEGDRGFPGADTNGAGQAGPRGPRGLAGRDGPRGLTGRQGFRGESGPPGRDGQYCPCPVRSFTSLRQQSFFNNNRDNNNGFSFAQIQRSVPRQEQRDSFAPKPVTPADDNTMTKPTDGIQTSSSSPPQQQTTPEPKLTTAQQPHQFRPTQSDIQITNQIQEEANEGVQIQKPDLPLTRKSSSHHQETPAVVSFEDNLMESAIKHNKIPFIPTIPFLPHRHNGRGANEDPAHHLHLRFA